MVADVSVIAAIAFHEPEAYRARGIIENAELYAPRLLAYELTNIACNKIRAEPHRRSGFTSDLGDGLAMNFIWREVALPDVMQLAMETGLSAYDASYLQLAIDLDTSLL